MSKRVTIKAINAAIKHLHFEIVRGNGYYYYAPISTKAAYLFEQSTCSMHLFSSLKDHVDDLEYKILQSK